MYVSLLVPFILSIRRYIGTINGHAITHYLPSGNPPKKRARNSEIQWSDRVQQSATDDTNRNNEKNSSEERCKNTTISSVTIGRKVAFQARGEPS